MSAKRVINDKLQGRIATYLRCGGDASEFFLIGEYLASYKQERDCLEHFVRLANALLIDGESARTNHVFASNFAKYSPILNFVSTPRLSNKPFLIRLLTTPPHLKYVATLPRNLSLMACFADINVSQGSVATYARCAGIFHMPLTANLPRNLPVKKNYKSVTI